MRRTNLQRSASRYACRHATRPQISRSHTSYTQCRQCQRDQTPISERIAQRLIDLEGEAEREVYGWGRRVKGAELRADPSTVWAGPLGRRYRRILTLAWRVPWTAAAALIAQQGKRMYTPPSSTQVRVGVPGNEAICQCCGGSAHWNGVLITVPRLGSVTTCHTHGGEAAQLALNLLSAKYPETEWRAHARR